MQLIAERLRGCRLRKGWSQEELATKANVSVRSVNAWEKTGGLPNMQNLRSLSETLGVSIPFLLGDEAEPQELKQDVKTYAGEKTGQIRAECHGYLDEVLDSCGDNEGQLYWTLEEMKRRLFVREPARPAPEHLPLFNKGEVSSEDVGRFVKAAEHAVSDEKAAARPHRRKHPGKS